MSLTSNRPAAGITTARQPQQLLIRRKKLYTLTDPKKSLPLTLLTGLFAIYCLLPIVWLVINTTKSQEDFVSTFGLAFGDGFALWDNIVQVLTFQDGIFARWLLNTMLYVVVGAVVSTFLAALVGYALAKHDFAGKRLVLFVVLGSISVPGIALAISQFLLFANLGITNTPWAVLIPSFLNPFGLYLMWVSPPKRFRMHWLRQPGLMEPENYAFSCESRFPLGSGYDHGVPVLLRIYLEQLLPPADHAERSGVVSADHRHQPMEQTGFHRRQR